MIYSRENRDNAWEAFGSNHQRGQIITRRVSRVVEDIGLFIELEGDLEGIVHLSDLDWDLDWKVFGKDKVQEYKPGDRLRLVILSIEVELERICLGLKQLKSRPDENGGENPDSPMPVSPSGPRPPSPRTEKLEKDC